MNQQAEAIFNSAQDMMDSIRSIKGAKFSRTVEVALCMLKMRALCGKLLSDLNDDLGRERCAEVFEAVNRVCAHVISLCASNADITDTADPGELLDWAEKILKLEEQGVKAMDD